MRRRLQLVDKEKLDRIACPEASTPCPGHEITLPPLSPARTLPSGSRRVALLSLCVIMLWACVLWACVVRGLAVCLCSRTRGVFLCVFDCSGSLGCPCYPFLSRRATPAPQNGLFTQVDAAHVFSVAQKPAVEGAATPCSSSVVMLVCMSTCMYFHPP